MLTTLLSSSARRSVSLFPLLLLVACGSDDSARGNGGSGGSPDSPGTPAAPGGGTINPTTGAVTPKVPGLDPSVAADALPPQKSGTRLKARYLVLDDGTRLVESFLDSQSGTSCEFRRTSKTQARCFPTDLPDTSHLENGSPWTRHLGTDCTNPDLLYEATSAAIPAVVQTTSPAPQPNGTTSICTSATEVFPAGLVSTIAVPVAGTAFYNDRAGTCGPRTVREADGRLESSFDGRFNTPDPLLFHLGPPVDPAALFVGATETTEAGKVARWNGSDGTSAWLQNESCSKSPMSLLQQSVGTGVVRANGGDPNQLFDTKRQSECAPEIVNKTSSELRCLSRRMCQAPRISSSNSPSYIYVYKDNKCEQRWMQLSALQGSLDPKECRIPAEDIATQATYEAVIPAYRTGRQVTFQGEHLFQKNAAGGCEAIPEAISNIYVEVLEPLPWSNFPPLTRIQDK